MVQLAFEQGIGKLRVLPQWDALDGSEKEDAREPRIRFTPRAVDTPAPGTSAGCQLQLIDNDDFASSARPAPRATSSSL
jgi:hypothetical protein